MWGSGPALLLALGLRGGQDPLAVEDVRGRVRAVVDLHFAEADPARRRDYTDRLTAPFLTAASHERASLLLEHLPEAALFHRVRVLSAEVPPVRSEGGPAYEFPSAKLPGPLLNEGFDLQVEYLSKRVVRALSVDRSPEARARIAQQVTA